MVRGWMWRPESCVYASSAFEEVPSGQHHEELSHVGSWPSVSVRLSVHLSIQKNGPWGGSLLGLPDERQGGQSDWSPRGKGRAEGGDGEKAVGAGPFALVTALLKLLQWLLIRIKAKIITYKLQDAKWSHSSPLHLLPSSHTSFFHFQTKFVPASEPLHTPFSHLSLEGSSSLSCRPFWYVLFVLVLYTPVKYHFKDFFSGHFVK